MKKLRVLAIILSIAYLFSCSKRDLPETTITIFPHAYSDPDFFQLSEHLPSPVKRVASALDAQNVIYHYTEDWKKRDGIPLWNEAEYKVRNVSKDAQGRVGGTDTVVMIPMAIPDSNIVNAFLICSVNTDTAFVDIVRASQYASYSFDSNTNDLSADDIALQFMALQYRCFGDSVFNILDNRLFDSQTPSGSSTKKVILRANSRSAMGKMEAISVTQCYEVVYNEGTKGQVVGVEPGGSVPYLSTGTVCTTYTFWFNSGGNGSDNSYTGPGSFGNGQGGGGGSGGSSGGGATPCGTPIPVSRLFYKRLCR